MRARPVIAIDGPSGVGKSTLAARLAQSLGFTRLDTGAMYRAVAWKALEADMDFEQADPLAELAHATNIILEPEGASTRVLVDGQDVSARLREPDVTQAASRVSVHAPVRAWLVDMQRTMGAAGGVVMEGRDIGTVVFPDAEVKFFLEASEQARSERRYLQQAGQANAAQTEEEVRRALHDRDRRDRERVASPLKTASDAVRLDTTELGPDQVLARALEIIGSRFPALAQRAPSA
jgi:cytidylate kinase